MAKTGQALWVAKVNELLGRLAHDAEWGAAALPLLQESLALATAQKAAGAAAGALGGRPAGSGRGAAAQPVWVEARGEWSGWVMGVRRAAELVNERYGYEIIKPKSLGALVATNGRWDKRVEVDDRVVLLTVRKPTEKEAARLAKAAGAAVAEIPTSKSAQAEKA